MSRKLKTAVAALFLALTVADAVWLQPSGMNPAEAATDGQSATTAEVGKPAPSFTLIDTNGKKRSLSDFKNKFVVLEWVNYECPFVKKHYSSGNMQKLQQAYAKKGVTWLSINSSAPGRQGSYPAAKVNQMIKDQKANPTAYLLDEDGKVGKMYGAKATPHMFVIDKKGQLIYSGAIDDISTADAADIPKSKNYVATSLDAAMAGKSIATNCTSAYGCSIKYQK